MARKRIKNTVRAVAVAAVWFFLMWVGFLAMDYQDDLVLGAYIIAGASGLAALFGWFLLDD